MKAKSQSEQELSNNLTLIQLKYSPQKFSNNVRINHTKSEPEPVIAPSDKTRIFFKSNTIYDATCISNPCVSHTLSPEYEQKNNNLVTLSSGDVINNRFVLEDVLGVGGMGKVYKAIDLRKKEAHDKNPYIAIKVLNDEFREHPESLIALQREARKSQQLSHPNIVNVHDFDRDGDVVYMTMELLKGRSLDEVIAEDYPHGMPEKQATPIINSVANAVLYAHQHGIIHSDLKPSNIFITDDNKAKIFDFGIARACQLSQEDSSIEHKAKSDFTPTELNYFQPTHFEPIVFDSMLSEPTLFDPTELGALTPTYASLEMLEGKAPEPHDDIFSIACVFYELLTGNHPYKRCPADKAKEKALQVNKISGLDKIKSKAIFKALELQGQNRFKSLELFIQAYNFKKKNTHSILFSFFALTMTVLFVFFPQLKEQYHFKQQNQFIASVNSLSAELNNVDLHNVQQHIMNLDNKTKNFVLKNIKNNWMNLIQNKINFLIDENNKKYQFDEALNLLELTQSYYSDSAQVARLYDLFEKQKFIEINRLNSQFNELLEILQFSPLLSHSAEQEEILQIVTDVKRIEATHPLVKDQRLLLIYLKNIQRLLSVYQRKEAHELLQNAQSIFPDEILIQNLIDKLKSLKNYYKHEMIISLDSDSSLINISSLKQKLAVLISKPELTAEWDSDVTKIYIQLSKKLGRRSIWLNEKKQTLASLYLQQSVSMRDSQRLIEARRFLEKSKEYNSGLFGLDDEESILLALENIVRVKQKAKQRLAKIEGLKTSLFTQLKAQKIIAALRSYQDLKRILGRNDPFISKVAKQNIAQAYYKQARQLFIEKEYQQTIVVINSGLKFERLHSGLRSLRKKAVKKQKLLNNSLLMAQSNVQILDKKINIVINREEKLNKN